TNALHKTWSPPISPNPIERDELEAAGITSHLSADAPRRAEQAELAGKGETPQPVPRATKPRASRRATRADAPRPTEQAELAGKGETPQLVPEERSQEQAAEQRAWHELALAAVKPRVGVLVAAALAIVLIGGSVTAWLALGPSANKSRIAATAPSPTLAPLANVGTPAA